MGIGYSISCTNCGYEKDYYLGKGFISLTTINELLRTNKNKRENEFMRYIMDHRNAKLVNDIGNRLYTCPTCNTLHSKYHIEIDYDDNEKYIKQHICGRCKSYLVPINNLDATKYKCKMCGEKSLSEFYGMIRWD